MLDLMDERRRWKHQTTETAKREYRRLNNKLRRETDKAEASWWNQQCDNWKNWPIGASRTSCTEEYLDLAREGVMDVSQLKIKMVSC